MARRVVLVLSVATLLMVSVAHAQRGAYNRYQRRPAMTPYGPVWNPTQTPEWKQAGGNMEVWQQLMMQKLAKQEQVAFQKQFQAYQKSLKSQKNHSNTGAGPFVPNLKKKAKVKKKVTVPSVETKSKVKTEEAKKPNGTGSGD